MPALTVSELFSSALIRIYDKESFSSGSGADEYQAQEYEILFTRRGTQLIEDEAGLQVGDVNSLIFLKRGQSVQLHTNSPEGAAVTAFVINHAELLKIIGRHDAATDDSKLLSFDGRNAPLRDHRYLLRVHLLRARLSRPNPNPLEIEEQVFHLLGDVLADASRWWAKRRRSLSSRASTQQEHRELVMRTKLVLAENYPEGLGLEEIARAALSSPYHLSRVFKQHTGYSIHQYLQQLRLRNTLERLITHPHEKLDKVANTFGFSSHSHFSTLFLRQFGISPSKFRQAMAVIKLRELVSDVPPRSHAVGDKQHIAPFGGDLMPPAPMMSRSLNWMTFDRFF